MGAGSKHSAQSDDRRQVVVIGSGLVGAFCALVLARRGLDVLVVEAGQHPRFALGESIVPACTLGLKQLADRYAIPELRTIAYYPALRSAGLTANPKRGGWFGLHRRGRRFSAGDACLFASPNFPTGPDVHLLRADVDAFLVSLLGRYGVEVRQQCRLVEVCNSATGVELGLVEQGSPVQLTADFLIDCSGRRSVAAEALGLRRAEPRFHTDSRALFVHMRGLGSLDSAPGSDRFPVRPSACTAHHCFDGGWMWLIPFDSGVTSVGLVLDRARFPDNDRPAEDEFFELVGRYPLIARQLANAWAVTPFRKTGRLQFDSHSMVAERVLLSPHAASFVDPLYSTGLDLALSFVLQAMPRVEAMFDEQDFSPERLLPIDRWYRRAVALVDLLVHSAYSAMRDPALFQQVWRTWLYGSFVQLLSQQLDSSAGSLNPTGHYGSELERWPAVMEQVHRLVTAPDGLDDAEVATLVAAQMDALDEPYSSGRSDWLDLSTDAAFPVPTGDLGAWFTRLAAGEACLAPYRERLAANGVLFHR